MIVTYKYIIKIVENFRSFIYLYLYNVLYMKSVVIQSKKLDIINRITSLDDIDLLEKVLQLLSTSSMDSNISYAKDEILTDLKQGLKELKMIQQGKLKSTPLKDFLHDL